MKATIWHNPRCGTSRTVLAVLQDTPGIALQVVEYLKHPPTPEALAALYARAGLTPREGLRTKEPLAATLATADDATLLRAMSANPILIERPLVETDKGAVLCRPAERVREVL